MADHDNTIRISALIDIPESALKKIVDSVRQIALPDKNGIFHVDTADIVGELITDFLAQKDFDAFVEDFSNYRLSSGAKR